MLDEAAQKQEMKVINAVYAQLNKLQPSRRAAVLNYIEGLWDEQPIPFVPVGIGQSDK
jgi:hypothetical protein